MKAAFALACLIPFSAVAQGAVPLRFERFEGPQAYSVTFTDFEFSADEVWYVGGSCATAESAAPLYVAPNAFLAELSIYLAPNNLRATRTVCIVNPEDAPASFWTAYSRNRTE